MKNYWFIEIAGLDGEKYRLLNHAKAAVIAYCDKISEDERLRLTNRYISHVKGDRVVSSCMIITCRELPHPMFTTVQKF